MKRIICLLTVFITVLATCTSCSSSRGANKGITYPIDSSPSTLDPQYSNEEAAQIAVCNIFEGLVRHNDKGEIIPGIATEWDVSSDGLVYRFKLKTDTEWYCLSSMKKKYGDKFYEKFCSEKVTAYDFEFACKRVIDPQTASPLANRMMILKNASDIHAGKADLSTLGVKAKSADTIEFRLAGTCEDFLDRLTESEFMPCNEEFFNKTGGRYGLGSVYLLCNGPFYLSYWDPDSGLTLKKNKYYSGCQQVIPSSVTLSIDNDPDSVSKKLGNAGVSAALLSPLSAVPEKCSVIKEIDNSVFGFIFNCSDSVLANESIRKAICMTIDKSIFKPVNEEMKVAYGLVPDSCLAGSETYRNKIGSRTPTVKYDEERAKRFWDWGMTELAKSSVTIKIICPASVDTLVRQQMQIWQKLFGLECAVSVSDVSEAGIDAAVSSGDFQIALGYISADRQNASDFLAKFKDKGTFRLSSDYYSNIVDNTLKACNDDDMITGCLTAEDFIISKGIFYPLYQQSSKFVLGEDVEGISILRSEATVSFINARRYD